MSEERDDGKRDDPTIGFAIAMMALATGCLLLHFAADEGFLGEEMAHALAPVKNKH